MEDRPRLVASDVDGTLLDPLERVSPRTARAITAVVSSGTPFVLVTGRPPRWIPPVSTATGLDGYAVCSNGAVIYHIGADRVISAHGLDPVLLNDIVHALDPVLPGMTVATERVTPSVADGSMPPFLSEVAYSNPWGDEEHRVGTRAEVLGHTAVKLLIRHPDMTSEEMAMAARAVLDSEVHITFSTSRGLIEIAARGVDKSTGLAEATELLELDGSGVVAFGDMPNDVAMLRWAQHGVAMANAHAEVLAVADEVTGRNSEDGVAQVLERWF